MPRKKRSKKAEEIIEQLEEHPPKELTELQRKNPPEQNPEAEDRKIFQAPGHPKLPPDRKKRGRLSKEPTL